MEKSNKRNKNKKVFLETTVGKIVISLSNIFFKARFDIYNQKPKMSQDFSNNVNPFGAVYLNSNYERDMMYYDNKLRRYRKENKKFWQRIIKRLKNTQKIKSL
jgi:hypothetical protein